MRQPVSCIVVIAFICSSVMPVPKVQAQGLLGLPKPGTMVSLSPTYQPAILKGLTVHQDNPFLFDFIVDVGQDHLQGQALKQEGEKLIKYFLASLAIADKDLWVNLSPYEKNKIVPQALGQTEMGRDLLEEDYILKQITASLIYPESGLGKVFWDRVYAAAQAKFATTQIPVNTFNKVWIVADKAEVFEHAQTVLVVNCHLKVMLEEDYLALQKHTAPNNSHSISSQIIREVVLPALEKEVNQGKNFAHLRQICNSLILASWYKKNLKTALLNQVYTDKEKIKGIDLQDKTIQEQIYHRYLEAYKKGVFNYIKEDAGLTQGVLIPRKYFSGGWGPGAITSGLVTTHDIQKAGSAMSGDGQLETIVAGMRTAAISPSIDAAMSENVDPTTLLPNFIAGLIKANGEKEVISVVQVYFNGFVAYVGAVRAFLQSIPKGAADDTSWQEKLSREFDDQILQIRKMLIRRGYFLTNSPNAVTSKTEFSYILCKIETVKRYQDPYGTERDFLLLKDIYSTSPINKSPRMFVYEHQYPKFYLMYLSEIEDWYNTEFAPVLPPLNRPFYRVQGGNEQLKRIQSRATDILRDLFKDKKSDSIIQILFKYEIIRNFGGELSLGVIYNVLEGESELALAILLRAINYGLTGKADSFRLKAKEVKQKNFEDGKKRINHFDRHYFFTKEAAKGFLRDVPIFENIDQIRNSLQPLFPSFLNIKPKNIKELKAPSYDDIADKVSDSAMNAVNPLVVKFQERDGGIDLNTQNIVWTKRKEGPGVEMKVDPAMAERVRREGIDSLTPEIYSITPVASIWPLLGLEQPVISEKSLNSV
jgi:hypothetical protein